MKRLITTTVIALICAVIFQPAVRSNPENKPHTDYSRLSKQQKQLLGEYEDFLMLLETFVRTHRTGDPEATARVLAAIEYARNADIAEKMNTIVGWLQEGHGFDALDGCRNIDTALVEIERLLTGAKRDIEDDIEGDIETTGKFGDILREVLDDMKENDVKDIDDRGIGEPDSDHRGIGEPDPDLDKHLEREKEIANRLKELSREAGKPGISCPGASSSLARAAAKSSSAVGKMSKAAKNGGSSGAGGASADQKDARDAVREAIKKIEERLALGKRIKNLVNVEESLKAMIKEQEAINATTVFAGAERSAFEEKNPGRRFDFGRAMHHKIDSARGRQSNLAFMTRKMAKILRDEGKFIFPETLDMIRDDMRAVVEKLKNLDVGEETQTLEADILRDLQRLLRPLHDDLKTLKEKYKRSGGPGGSGGLGGSKPPKPGNRRTEHLPSLAELKLLRIMQLEVKFQTSQLAEAHRRRIATIDADRSLSPAERERMKHSAVELKLNLGKRLASRQARIEELTRELIEHLKKRRPTDGKPQTKPEGV